MLFLHLTADKYIETEMFALKLFGLKHWYAHNALDLTSSYHVWKELGNLDHIIISSRPLSVVPDLPLLSFTLCLF